MLVSLEIVKGWINVFKYNSFKVISFPYIVLYRKFSVHRRKVLDYLQHPFDLGLVVKSAGLHPSGFTSKANDASPTLGIAAMARHASAVNVSSCVSKQLRPDSKSHIRSSEKNPELLLYIIHLFSPSQLLIIYP